MAPNVLWLAEALSQKLELRPGMRVLDMGCGKAISSIFLAKEFGIQVWATDLWISAGDNWERIRAAQMQERVFPIHAEAHALPYADGFSDALVSLDAYHYFGTDDLYLGYYARFVKPGGQIGIVVPGLQHEFAVDSPVIWNLTGAGISGAFIARTGGGSIGPKRAKWTCFLPIVSPMDGDNGCSGIRYVSRPGILPSQKRSACWKAMLAKTLALPV